MSKKNLHFVIVIFSISLLMFSSCEKPVDPDVTTSGVTDITQTTAKCGGTVNEDGGADVTERGVCVGISQTADLGDLVTVDGSGLGTFTSSITGLTPGTTYYARAYATNKQGTGYGGAIVFTTLP